MLVAKKLATLESEIHKDINIQINRRLLTDEITKLFGEDTAKNIL